ncbi:hypothetical protein RF11_00470 [Thelohanellus kitauei]|uniref:Uncharacterized protein n=1 Tax=Thelohanellus kitauei TaxID=669202 RepID=A0A0C2MSD3_THEKT|nr:hypothetical protein RF11_00470 [Thelohanellus kitauei]
MLKYFLKTHCRSLSDQFISNSIHFRVTPEYMDSSMFVVDSWKLNHSKFRHNEGYLQVTLWPSNSSDYYKMFLFDLFSVENFQANDIEYHLRENRGYYAVITAKTMD